METSANLKSQVTRTGKVTLLDSENKNYSNKLRAIQDAPLNTGIIEKQSRNAV